MKPVYYISLGLLIITLSFNSSLGQPPGGSMQGEGPPGGDMRGGGNSQRSNQMMVSGYIMGTLTDSLQNPVEFASAAVYRADSFEPVTGVITNDKGSFVLKNIPLGNFALEISYVGFRKIRINNITLTSDKKEIKLGDIVLIPSQEMLDGITITGEAPTVDYKIDRKVISVSQDIVARGGSVIEALENVPSVKTDINGDVTIRGSANFTVLIDGKPSVLNGSDALQQIPANAVENIEILTNPSARYDPDGDSGIINIIMKKNFSDGISAIINGSAGTPKQYGFDFTTVYRAEKGTVTLGFDYRNRDMEVNGNIYRETYYGDTTETQSSTTTGNRGRGNMNLKLGYDMNLGTKNTLSIQGTFGKRKNNNFTRTNSIFGIIPDVSQDYYELSENTSNKERFQYNTNATFIRNFNLNGHKLEMGVQVMGSNNESLTDLIEYETDSNWTLVSPVFTQSNIEESDNMQIRINADYVNPFDNGGKLEAGYQARIEDTDSHFVIYNMNEGDDLPQRDSSLNDLNIFRNIQGVYGVYSNSVGYLGYQVGIRTEYTGRDVNQITTGETFEIDRIDFFPSLHLSYKFISGDQMQASYSRRVNRPRDRQLNPFPTYIDSRNMRIGNPTLEPEFNEDGTIISTYDNLNQDQSYGLEAMASLQFFEWWRFTLSSSIYQYTIQGEVTGENIDNSSVSWNGRIMSMFTIPWDIRLQINGNYNSAKASAQGSREGFMMTNVAIRKDFFNSKLGVTFQVRDIFQQMNFSSTSESELFYSENAFRPVTPMFSLNVSLKLNNYKKSRGRYGSDANMIEMDYQSDFAY
jgi:outer membrane receptor protein involved in Fe transport